jgi:prepilin-type N-terminal cleavage/methylation domain-containing protein
MRNQSLATRSIPACTHGFTAIELLTVMAIIAIIAAIAMPDLSNLLVNQRLRAAGTDLMSSLIVARSEAIKRNGPVEVRPAAPTGRRVGSCKRLRATNSSTRRIRWVRTSPLVWRPHPSPINTTDG